MSNPSHSGEHRAAAQSLGLKVPAYLHLRQAYIDGEAPIWLRSADPELAGLFQEDAFAFELLWERVGLQLGLERRRANLLRAVEKLERQDLVEPIAQAMDEGELEDYSFVIEPSAAPEGHEAPEDEKLQEYLQAMRGCHDTAAALRVAFREHGLIKVAVTGKEGVDAAPFQSLVDLSTEVRVLPPAKYLQIRRGERAHAITAEFELPLGEVKKVFDKTTFPVQERERYFTLFQTWVKEERLPRLHQEARAKLKRTVETAALRNAWEQLEFSINRGRHHGGVLGLCGVRGGKVQLSLIGADGEYQRAALLMPKSSGFASELHALLGDDMPGLMAYQGDTSSRNLAQKVAKLLRNPGGGAPKTAASAAKAPPAEKAAADAKPSATAPAAAADTAADNAKPAEAALAEKTVPVEAAASAEPIAPAEAASTETAAPAENTEVSAPVAEAPAEAPAETPAETPAEAKSVAEATSAEASKPAAAAKPAEEAKAASKSGGKQSKKKGAKIRMAHVPIAVARTLQREVARRGAETLLSHDERQAYLLARFAWDPRAAALHTPHVVRAFISFRGEINHRRLEEFEVTFLRSLLVEKGIDLNQAPVDVLRMVPGVDAEGIVIERSTGHFRSLEEYCDRMGPSDRDFRASACLLRVAKGEQVLDSRRLHPVYYSMLNQLVEASDMSMSELMRKPAKVSGLEWDELLAENRWRKHVIQMVRNGLERGQRRRRPAAPRGHRTVNLDSLEVGSTVKGKVTALTAYGAFVDIGAGTEGLVHISEMADSFVKDPATVLQPGQEVEARVLSVDIEKQRFRLSLRSEGSEGGGAEEEHHPSYVRSTRPRGGGPGGRRGGGRGGPGGRGGGRGDGPGGRRRKGEKLPPDPKRQKKEEIDPTNPFFVFFQNKDD